MLRYYLYCRGKTEDGLEFERTEEASCDVRPPGEALFTVVGPFLVGIGCKLCSYEGVVLSYLSGHD